MNRLFFLLVPIFVIIIAGCGGGGGGGGNNSALPTSVALPNGSVLSWTAPTKNADTPPTDLTDLAGYKISYGPTGGPYVGGTITIGLIITYDAAVLPSGYTCFVVRAYDTSGNESINSDQVCDTI